MAAGPYNGERATANGTTMTLSKGSYYEEKVSECTERQIAIQGTACKLDYHECVGESKV